MDEISGVTASAGRENLLTDRLIYAFGFAEMAA
jgi:hypothetical protein